MDPCEGLKDWLLCAKCPYLCTKKCPIESENVIEELKRRINLLKESGAQER
jgi:hypothetical protein